MRNLSGLAPMVPSLVMVLFAVLGIRRTVQRMKSLPGDERALTRNTMISAFAGALSLSFAGLAYLLWFYDKNKFLLMLATVGLVVFVASVIWIGRISWQWSELKLRRKQSA